MPETTAISNHRTAEQELERLLADAVAEARRWQNRAELAEARVNRLLTELVETRALINKITADIEACLEMTR